MNRHQPLLQLLLLVSLLVLLGVTKALTFAELGTVATINGVPCRFCDLDCESTPLLRNCKTRYYRYGCHINQYCLTINTATAREFFAGLAICIYRNGCELTTTDERTLLAATAEGSLDLRIKDMVAATKSLPATNMFKLQSEVYNLYSSEIANIESTWINSADKLTEGKRQAFQITNVSPAFFVIQEMVQMMATEQQFWKPYCDNASTPPGQHGTEAFFVTPTNTDSKVNFLLRKCNTFATELSTYFGNDQYNYMRSASYRNTCMERAFYVYVYGHLCKLPREFIKLAQFADQLVNSDATFLLAEALYDDITKTQSYKYPVVSQGSVTLTPATTSLPRIFELHAALQEYAFRYVDIMTNEQNAVTRLTRLNDIKTALKNKSALCNTRYCTYSCKDYAYDIVSKYCDVFDDGINIVRDAYTKLCTVTQQGYQTEFLDTAEVRTVQASEESHPALKYCKRAQRNTGRVKQEQCIYNAIKSISVSVYKTYGKSRNYISTQGKMMNGVAIEQPKYAAEFDSWFASFSNCMGGAQVCSLAGGCDVQAADLAAIMSYLDSESSFFVQFMSAHSFWNELFTQSPKRMFVKGAENYIWTRSMVAAGYWTNWESLGGSSNTAPTPVAFGTEGGAMVFIRNQDMTTSVRTFSYGRWQDWVNLGGSAITPPASIVLNDGTAMVFVVSNDNQIYYRKLENNNWSPWTVIPGAAASTPVVSMWGMTTFILLTRDPNGSIKYKLCSYGVFSEWVSLDGYVTGEPSFVYLGDGRAFVFARGTDGALYYRFNQNQRWEGWTSLGAVMTANPYAVAWGGLQDKVTVFIKGTENSIWYRQWQNGVWTGWLGLDGIFTSAPLPVRIDPFRIAVLVKGTENSIWYRITDNGKWIGWWNSFGGYLTSEAPAIATK